MPSGLTLPSDTSDVIGPTDDWVAGLTAQWVLFDSGERGGRRKSAKAVQKAAAETERQMRQDVVMAVHQAFYECVAAKEARSVADAVLARAGDHLKLAQDKIKAGAAAQADESRVQVEVANAKLGVLRAESRLRIARGSLNTVMGLTAEGPMDVVKPEDVVMPPGGVKIGDLMDQALKDRPDLQIAVQHVAAARADVAAAKSAYGPKVTAQGSYDRREGDLAGPDNEWLFGVSVDLPLFSGFGTVHRVSKAQAALSQTEAECQQRVLNVRNEIWTAYSRLLESYQSVQATVTQVSDAGESRRLAMERYKAGAGTMNDLLDAETALARSEATQIEAQKDYHVADAAFRRAIGRLTAEN
jgi:outer membrane protein TolC